MSTPFFKFPKKNFPRYRSSRGINHPYLRAPRMAISSRGTICPRSRLATADLSMPTAAPMSAYSMPQIRRDVEICTSVGLNRAPRLPGPALHQSARQTAETLRIMSSACPSPPKNPAPPHRQGRYVRYSAGSSGGLSSSSPPFWSFLSRSCSMARFSPAGTGTPIIPAFSTMLRPSLPI